MGSLRILPITTAKNSILGVVKYAKENLKYSKLFLFGISCGGSGLLGAISELNLKDISGLIFRCTIINY